jgi:hypothetical protein
MLMVRDVSGHEYFTNEPEMLKRPEPPPPVTGSVMAGVSFPYLLVCGRSYGPTLLNQLGLCQPS